MAPFKAFAGETGPLRYALAASLLLLAQPLSVMLIFHIAGWPLANDASFWFLPLRRLALVRTLSATQAAIAFALGLTVTGTLAVLSFRRAQWSRVGYVFAALTIVPGVQIVAAAILALLPRNEVQPDPKSGFAIAHIIQGLVAGVAIIVLAVLVSALSFGAYGWSLFVMTPLLVGVTTGYLANRRHELSAGSTAMIVLAAAVLGTASLILFALEGLVCILMASPLGVLAALLGGAIGRAAARAGQSGNRPLLGLALLPGLFALEGAMPPSVPIETHAAIDIAAPPSAVWAALIDAAPITGGPGLVGVTGLAYPVRGRLLGTGVGAIRLGDFSTGTAREQVVEWQPDHRLAFRVLHQPPAMEEMSPYRHVHAPHVNGYFTTGETRFSLIALAGRRTRLVVAAAHRLRIDPALYWEPLARLAIRLNVSRVLDDIRVKAELSPLRGHRKAAGYS
ncbi:SRPBCC family protein, partial [Sphingomonas sp. MMSM20]|uniref:SRPBCC family protein n=1 Tax=Sphingomonas lycopersici TaxID=2951807 RepID=UPI002238DAA1